jgi:hypothetical protein
MKNTELANRRFMSNRITGKNRHNSLNKQSASKETEARESLINLLEMDPVV